MEVVGVPDDKITISWRAKSDRDEHAVSVKLQRSGPKEASLSVQGPGDQVHYRIEVPRQSNVSIEMSAGELAVQGVTGSLSVEMMAGEMDLRVGDSSRYRNVRASVLAGEITARPWKVDISGVSRPNCSRARSRSARIRLRSPIPAALIAARDLSGRSDGTALRRRARRRPTGSCRPARCEASRWSFQANAPP